MALQTLSEALVEMWTTDPSAVDAAVDYLADLGRLEAVVAEVLW